MPNGHRRTICMTDACEVHKHHILPVTFSTLSILIAYMHVLKHQTHIKYVATLNDEKMYQSYKNDPSHSEHAHLVSKHDFLALKPFWIGLPVLL
jgi:hypothetical protein